MFSTPALFFLHCFWPKRCFCHFRWKLVLYAPSVSEVLYPKVQIPEGWFAPNKPRTQRLFGSAHYTCVVRQHAVTWIRLQCSWPPIINEAECSQDSCKSCARAVLKRRWTWARLCKCEGGVVRMLKLKILSMQSRAAKFSTHALHARYTHASSSAIKYTKHLYNFRGSIIYAKKLALNH